MSRNKDHEWLKVRTIHVKGIPPEDRSGNHLKMVLERVLGQTGGQVLAVIVVPDFVRQLDIEGKIQDLKDLQMLIKAKEVSGEPYTNCCIPRKYTN